MSLINVILALMIIGSFMIAMVIHQYTQALTASLLGDPTPRSQGRQSLNPGVHIDPLGLLLSIVMAFMPVVAGPMALGWGKPIKTDPWKLRGGPNVGTLLVSLSGIVVNLIVGFLVAFLIRFLPADLILNGFSIRFIQFVTVFASVNIALGLFNILPLYPLDGYQILYTLLPSRQALKFARSAQYGPLIIIAILFVLPFLGTVTRTDGFFLFRLSYFFLQGVLSLVSLASGYPLLITISYYLF